MGKACTHEDLSSSPQNPHKVEHHSMYLSNPGAFMRSEVKTAHRSGSLVYTEANKKSCLKQRKRQGPTPNVLCHMCPLYTCMHTHIHTETDYK